jgi:tRNA-splicing ligase RtcB
MSRNEAKRRYTVDDLIAQTEGVESRKDAGVLDELPAAYKDIESVIAAQSDLVEVVAPSSRWGASRASGYTGRPP